MLRQFTVGQRNYGFVEGSRGYIVTDNDFCHFALELDASAERFHAYLSVAPLKQPCAFLLLLARLCFHAYLSVAPLKRERRKPYGLPLNED